MKVWILFGGLAGEGDWNIYGVYSDEGKAHKACKKLDKDDPEGEYDYWVGLRPYEVE